MFERKSDINQLPFKIFLLLIIILLFYFYT